jgi:signal transduction histidine kinase
MALQRQRLAESQVLDRQTRRLLHDDVLPRLHAIMLALSEGKSSSQAPDQSIQALGELHRQISDLLRELPAAPALDIARMGLIGALRKLVDGELKGAYDQVNWLVPPDIEKRLGEIPAFKAEVLFYAAREALRNAARHAGEVRSEAPLRLCIQATWQEGLLLSIEDNGGGIKESGGSQAGSGQGLTLHSTLMAVIGGSLSVESTPGVSTRVLLRLSNG